MSKTMSKSGAAERPSVRSALPPGLRAIASELNRFDPNPVRPPCADPHLGRMPAFQRPAAVLQYHLRRLEYALSPDRVLRAWTVTGGRLAWFVLVPLLFWMPALLLLAAAAAALTALVLVAVVNVLKTLAAAAVIICGGAVLLSLFGRD